MPARLIFLGTTKQLKNSAGIVLQTNKTQLHIDPGAGAIARASQMGIDTKRTTALLVSHAHIAHCSDVNAAVAEMSYSGIDRKGILISNSTLIKGVGEEIPYLTMYHKNSLEKVIILNQDDKIAVEDVEIHPLKAIHQDPNAMGFRIMTSEFVLSYSGDTRYSSELISQYRDSDILLLNVAEPFGETSSSNLTSEDAVKLILQVMPKLTIITHFGEKMLKANPMNEAREIQRLTGIQTIAARDRLIITPTSYSELPQKKLNVFTLPKMMPMDEIKKEEIVPEEPNEIKELRGILQQQINQ